MKPDQSRSDVQLIEQLLAGVPEEVESAFEALIKRHGPMVRGVCRHLLGDHHDAEDAFQATFLTLFRGAGTIKDRRVLAGWLHRVAHRKAVTMRARAARHRPTSAPAEMVVATAEAEDTAMRDEFRRILHAELDRLPEKYRAPVVHCYLEGKSNREVARLVGCPVGTIKGRLWRARELLREQLLVRGLGWDRLVCP
jgi:RNA polymerase sigma factor (sigma-70 family)